MTELASGAYEHVLTKGLERQLLRIDQDLVETTHLDPADSREVLSRRLHARAWFFRRATGTSTAYVGSSNLSRSALIDGMEWNVRLSQLGHAAVTKEADGDLGAPPYLYAGPMTYVQHTGDRPMRILWRLAHPLPADVFHAARIAAGWPAL